MKKKSIKTIYGLAILAVIMLFMATNVQALTDWDIYSDAIIVEGDEYSNVSIYDTPPDRTTVSMFGGWVSNLQSYDSSIFNMFGGTAEACANDQSTFNIAGGKIYTLNLYDSSSVNVFGGSVYGLSAYDTGTVNVWGNANLFALFAHDSGVINMTGGVTKSIAVGEFGTVNLLGGLVSDKLWAGDSSIINLYGYDLAKFPTGGHYGFGFVIGEWPDMTAFNIDLSGPDTYSRVILYEIPEPATALLIAIGTLFLRKHRML